MTESLPVAVIGGGPIGLAAASHLVLRGVSVKLLEAGQSVGHNLRDWGHVKLFSVWSQCVDEGARELLARAGWEGVPEDQLPTGQDLVRDYLEPLAATPELSSTIETDSRVVQVVRQGLDRLSSKQRDGRPFEITIENGKGERRRMLARAVIDTSGTWQNPNPFGANGWPAEGERELASVIRYGIPDIGGADRAQYAGKRVAVIGGGHSAANALLDLALLAEHEPGTSMTWVIRGNSLATVFGGGEADQLPARGALGRRLKALTDAGRLNIVMSFAANDARQTSHGIVLSGLMKGEPSTVGPFDRIIVATGQRPDFSFARELQLDLHPAVESTRALGPLIDPNFHSCGTVPPHGWRELAHAEPGYFVAGVKSYGRAPTFLLLTGYEQVRSIAAHLGGNHVAADDVRLVLPETGVCSATLEQVAPGGGVCCGGSAAEEAEACCEKPHIKTAPGCCFPQPANVVRSNTIACCG
ncbi:NAD(P)-binding domain-containing protein [Aestuariivirga sp.]|uniref:NAD(P)-binding domain-containing protein n=1 Tax=Aestuariivirga sp. TaxID=2650926 RepID=UPI00359339CC